MLLPPEAASFGEPGAASSGLAEDSGTPGADHDSLCVTEDSGDPNDDTVTTEMIKETISPVTAGTLDVHEVAIGVLDQPLQLVLSLLLSREGVQQILSKRHL